MTDKVKIDALVFEAIDELNEQLPEEQLLIKSPDTVLLGDSGNLDSLGLVNLIVLIEQKMEEELGFYIALADSINTTQEGNPFETIGSLQSHILLRFQEEGK